MILEIYENLFKPITDDEFAERRKALYPLIRQFEDEIRDDKREYMDAHDGETDGFIEFYSNYSEYYSDGEDVDWYVLYLYFKFDAEIDDEPETEGLLNDYLKWKGPHAG